MPVSPERAIVVHCGPLGSAVCTDQPAGGTPSSKPSAGALQAKVLAAGMVIGSPALLKQYSCTVAGWPLGPVVVMCAQP
ncbi:MAG: hypothetical protein BWY91_02781 [bacterium ADurb.BinA028]|nr:MAG: hypothetical protein BWY91_02781 [bacterium ADurb.BinA028]